MAFVGWAGILVALVGLISILIPLRFLGVETRGAGGLVATAGFLIFIFALLAPEPSPEPVREVAQPDPAAAPPPPAQPASPEPLPEAVPERSSEPSPEQDAELAGFVPEVVAGGWQHPTTAVMIPVALLAGLDHGRAAALARP